MEVCVIRWDPELSFLRPDSRRESRIEAVKDTLFLAMLTLISCYNGCLDAIQAALLLKVFQVLIIVSSV